MYAQIIVDVPLRTLFTYHLPQELESQVKRGSWVMVPFGRRTVVGLCLGLSDELPKNPPKTIKDVSTDLSLLAEHPKLSDTYLKWLEFAAGHYGTPIGQVLAQAVPSYYFNIKKLQKDKAPKARSIPLDSDFEAKAVSLTTKQMAIFDKIHEHGQEFYPSLLHGITGSGKTEIYIHLIKEALKRQQSALFLVPEIGLTPQMLARLNCHFEGKMLIYHSGLTPNQKLNQWQSCLADEPKVMVGTRSALFAPFKNLGLIIIDEEHDTSYKQDDRFRYHARDLAVIRSKLLNIPVILGSATPSLESYYLSKEGKYHYFELNERVGKAELPDIRVVDYGKEKEQTTAAFLVSQNIHQAIDHFYKKQEQMIIFVGQRGYAQNAYCTSCSNIQVCPNCTVGLKHHKYKNQLKCHYCDFEKPFDEVCLSCGQKSLTLLGFGTQSVEEEIQDMHPKLIIKRLDSDSVSTPKQMHEVFSEFAKGKINMIIGTQMISKGHDFSNVGFVGILGIDAHLGLPEFRANERSFQNLVQVAGRSGRSGKKGHVIVQSLMPDHPAIHLGVQQDYKKFADEELLTRQALSYPPYSRIIQIRFLSNHEGHLQGFLNSWRPFLQNIQKTTSPVDLQILGPSEMPVAKVRGKHRHHIILKLRRGLKHRQLVDYILNDLESRKLKNIQFQVDVDAMGLV